MNDEEAVDDDDEEDQEYDFELQRKLLKVRKLFHRSNIQDVIKEGQILIVQVVKEERGNKGAALTTYLSLAGRYCVLMPNRIKSGGVSRKITNAADRKRLKSIVRELPLTSDMSMIVRTAGEDKTKADIVRDYNYLIRSWNQIRLAALSNKAPALIHEEGNLIKRALRDMYTKEISEIIVDGDEAYQMARDFVKILSPHNLKKIKSCKKNDIPLFQRFQVEGQLDKLHDCNVQLESGGYLVINPTEALVSIDVNSGRATKEKDLEETALKTNLEAADEIAKQLRMRNLAGLIVVDFIDMEDPQNNHAVEKRMKEAMKQDRARVQIAKMSCFGLLEISRQRMHSSFMESNYQVCPHCHGQGVVRTTESGAVLILRAIEEEGIKNRSAKISIAVPTETAIYLLNQKRQTLCALEQRYKMEIVICADDGIKNVAEFKLERVKSQKEALEEKKAAEETSDDEPRREENNGRRNNRRSDRRQTQPEEKAAETENTEIQQQADENGNNESTAENGELNNNRRGRRRDRRRDRRGRDRRRDRRERGGDENEGSAIRENDQHKEKAETIILYNSHEDIKSNTSNNQETDEKQGKTNWWRKLIG
ncbi:MAG: Rne/Rng family ribonuclease [Azospirillum sp.]|nr:Rne/Rng family ribonuclease [Azospirillum sp.]